MTRRMRPGPALVLTIGLFSLVLPLLVHADQGDAETSRIRNLQYFEMIPSVHPPGDSYVTRTRNFQYFEMVPSVHSPGNASIWRYRNLQFFQMTPPIHSPGNASAWRYRNLQFFEMTQSETISVSITSFLTTDQDGNPKNTFKLGSLVLFKVVIFGSGPQDLPDALVSVMVQDPMDTPMFLSYTFEDIHVGQQTTVYLGLQIPYDSMLGEFTAKVNIFTQLPSQGGEPIIGGHEEATFMVS